MSADKESVPDAAWFAAYDVIHEQPGSASSDARTWRALFAALNAIGYALPTGSATPRASDETLSVVISEIIGQSMPPNAGTLECGDAARDVLVYLIDHGRLR